MDTISALLDGPRGSDVFVLRCVLEAPWSLRIEDQAAMSLIAVSRGSATIEHDDGSTVTLVGGDVALVKGPDHYVLADSVGREPSIRIDTAQQCWSLDGEPLETPMRLGIRTWGNSPTGSTAFVTASYDLRSQVSPRLLDVLPRTLVIGGDQAPMPLLALLNEAAGRDGIAQEVVLDRLSDLVLVETLRAWFAGPDAEVPRWWAAQDDPIVGPALLALQHDLARPWTVALLARHVGASRATLARRFHDLVGDPPMTFLADWRLSVAADLLRGTDLNLAVVAERVGYGTPFSLSNAFKRSYGVSPRTYRLGPSGMVVADSGEWLSVVGAKLSP